MNTEDAGGVYLARWHEDDDMLVRAPGLEPKSGGEEPFSLLRELSLQCLENIRKGRTANAKQLLSMLAGVVG